MEAGAESAGAVAVRTAGGDGAVAVRTAHSREGDDDHVRSAGLHLHAGCCRRRHTGD